MKQWELTFQQKDGVYEARVPEEVQELLEAHRYVGISFGSGRALQLFTETQVEDVNRRLEASARGRHAARLFFSKMFMLDEPGLLQIPAGLAAYIEMDAWDGAPGILLLDDRGPGKVYLLDAGSLSDFMEGLEAAEM